MYYLIEVYSYLLIVTPKVNRISLNFGNKERLNGDQFYELLFTGTIFMRKMCELPKWQKKSICWQML